MDLASQRITQDMYILIPICIYVQDDYIGDPTKNSYSNVCAYVCMSVYVCMYVYMYMQMYMNMCWYICTCVYMYVDIICMSALFRLPASILYLLTGSP